jgi:hypothetical protein
VNRLIAAACLLATGLTVPAGSPDEVIVGQGAAGVAEVGRPLDVLRTRAEHEARERATDALVRACLDLVNAAPGVHKGKDWQEKTEARVRTRVASGQARWQLGYWSNGAVTARVELDADVLGIDP